MADDARSPGANAEQVQIGIEWPTDASLSLLPLANQFLAQIGNSGVGMPEEIILSIGNASPPLVYGSQEEQEQQIARLSSVRVVPVARFALSRSRAAELVQVLQETLHTWDQVQAVRLREARADEEGIA